MVSLFKTKLLRNAVLLAFSLGAFLTVSAPPASAAAVCQGWFGKVCSVQETCSSLGLYSKCVTEYMYFGWNEA